MSPAIPDHDPYAADRAGGGGDTAPAGSAPTPTPSAAPEPAPPSAADGSPEPATRPAVSPEPAPAGQLPDRPASQPGPAVPHPGMWSPVAAPRTPRRPGRLLAVGAAAVLVLTGLGVPLGLLWQRAAPGVTVVKTADGLAVPEPEQVMAADGWFSLLGLGFGVLVAITVWLLFRRYRGPFGIVVAALGALGAALVAWRLGRQIGLAGYHHLLATAPVGETFVKPPDLRAGGFGWLYAVVPAIRGDLLLPAFGAVVTYTLLAGWSRWPTLRPEPAPTLSWDWPVPPAPPAPPAPPEPGVAEPPRG